MTKTIYYSLFFIFICSIGTFNFGAEADAEKDLNKVVKQAVKKNEKEAVVVRALASLTFKHTNGNNPDQSNLFPGQRRDLPESRSQSHTDGKFSCWPYFPLLFPGERGKL